MKKDALRNELLKRYGKKAFFNDKIRIEFARKLLKEIEGKKKYAILAKRLNFFINVRGK